MTKWTKERDNDTGPNDDFFQEWWNITDGVYSFKCTNEEDADFLLSELNHVKQSTEQEPVAMRMDVIVVNLVREGINKHRARELAEHFIKYTQPQETAPRKPLTDEEIRRLKRIERKYKKALSNGTVLTYEVWGGRYKRLELSGIKYDEWLDAQITRKKKIENNTRET